MDESAARQHQHSTTRREDMCSCFAATIIIITFSFFASITHLLGFYDSMELVLGPNCSRLLHANPFFVQDITLKAAPGNKMLATLYGFLDIPLLDKKATWSDSWNTSIPPNSYKEWIYYLNSGAQAQISYHVQGSQRFILVVARGKESLVQWIENPLNPDNTMSWYLIQGDGMIQQNIIKSSDYYIAVQNLNQLEVEVQLDFQIQTLLYDTTDAHYKCSLDKGLCVLKLFLWRTSSGIVTTSNFKQSEESDEWYVELSYGPRWITYFVGSVGMILVILLALKIVCNLQLEDENGTNDAVDSTSERSPLLQNRDDDISSLGSSYDSISLDEEDTKESTGVPSKLLKEGDNSKPAQVCLICCDARRSCFFLPCGHCATCFTCGIRTMEEAGSCPICQRNAKKLKKIFAV